MKSIHKYIHKYWTYKLILLGVFVLIIGIFYPASFTKIALIIFGALMIIASYLRLKKNKIGFYIYIVTLGFGVICLLLEGFSEKNITKIIGGVIFIIIVCTIYFYRETIMKLDRG